MRPALIGARGMILNFVRIASSLDDQPILLRLSTDSNSMRSLQAAGCRRHFLTFVLPLHWLDSWLQDIL